MKSYAQVSTRIETWNVEAVTASGNVTRKNVGKIVARNGLGQFDGATNYRQASKVGQVRKSRR